MPIRTSQAPRVALIPFFVLVGSCGLTDPDFDTDGVVRFVDVEGGCWAIEAGDERLEPINLPEEFRVDGLAVTFEANDAVDVASLCQIGRPVEIEFIQLAG